MREMKEIGEVESRELDDLWEKEVNALVHKGENKRHCDEMCWRKR